MTNAEIHTAAASGFSPHDALIRFGWPVSSLYLYLYLNLGIIAFLWLVRSCQPETRERCLRRTVIAEVVLFALVALWAACLLYPLHVASQDIAGEEMQRDLAFVEFVQARDFFVIPAMLSGIVAVSVSCLLWRSARNALAPRMKPHEYEPRGA